MSIRLSGIASGMDTDSMVKELVKASSTKKTDLEKAQTKLEWKQTAWKSLNTKIYSFFSKSLSNMRLEGSYSKKSTTVADSSVATVVAGDSAVNGTQTLAVTQMAKAGYLTGGVIGDGVTKVTADTKVSSLCKEGGSIPTSFAVSVGGTSTNINVATDTTIGDVVKQLQAAGVSASFDATNQRMFVNVSDSGASKDFNLSTASKTGFDAMFGLGLIAESEVTGTGAKANYSTYATDLGITASNSTAVRVAGQDAKIQLNGAEFSSNSNTFTVNGLTITAKALSDITTPATGTTPAVYKNTSISTDTDVTGIYDMIKTFMTDYNTLINGMDSQYNAVSAKGYEPLSSDEKESMTDAQITDWESKIKTSLLRRDTTLSTVTSAMKNAMAATVDVDGTKMGLVNFGIETLSYFVAADNEKGAYHIDGDTTDSNSSGNVDKLKTAIASDPEKVASFFSKLTNSMYDELNKQMKSTDYRSIYHVYDDKKMTADYKDYTDKIKVQGTKLTDLEDHYYAQFSAMETAISKLNSQKSALSSLLGG